MTVSLGMPSSPPPVLAPRRKSRQIKVGSVLVGGDAPVSVQSMTTTLTADVFVPLIPALIGCGILAGVNGLLVNAGWVPGLTPALAAINKSARIQMAEHASPNDGSSTKKAKRLQPHKTMSEHVVCGGTASECE